MPITIIRNDITTMQVDAVVNAANSSLLGGGGVDGCIHRAAGPKLLAKCRTLGGCAVGDAKLTRGYCMPCTYIIHTVGPIWQGGNAGEEQALISCYRRSLALATAHNCHSIAFPLISSGVYGYPKDLALKVAMETIQAFLLDSKQKDDLMVYLVIYDRAAYQISNALYHNIQQYIDDRYIDANPDPCFPRHNVAPYSPYGISSNAAPFEQVAIPNGISLEAQLQQVDESFSQMLLRKIDERGISDAQCYKKANIDRKLFSKIRKDIHYKPSKPTALAFAVALELSYDECCELLQKAGFALSRSSKFDIIVAFFIRNGNYNLFEINEALFAFDQSMLGA